MLARDGYADDSKGHISLLPKAELVWGSLLDFREAFFPKCEKRLRLAPGDFRASLCLQGKPDTTAKPWAGPVQ